MRCSFLITVSMLLTSAAVVSAQPRALAAAQGRMVFVIDEDRREWQGRLTHVSADALEVESDAGVRTFKLAEVRRVDADGDGIGDGFLKGFAIGSLLSLGYWLSSEARWATLGTGLVYGLIGAGIDAGCSGRHPVFHGAGAPRLADATGARQRALAVGVRLRW
jgi:hypothetical protein